MFNTSYITTLLHIELSVVTLSESTKPTHILLLVRSFIHGFASMYNYTRLQYARASRSPSLLHESLFTQLILVKLNNNK